MTTGAKAGAQASRKIIVYIATSVDGYIARSDGGVEWLNRPLPKDGYGVDAFARSIDTVLWGRKTYDFALGGLGAYGNLKHYVFSSQPPSDPTVRLFLLDFCNTTLFPPHESRLRPSSIATAASLPKAVNAS
jgi:dihydrofolate reductase